MLDLTLWHLEIEVKSSFHFINIMLQTLYRMIKKISSQVGHEKQKI
jgi:hypothetical protein